jgi:hypothetical protein
MRKKLRHGSSMKSIKSQSVALFVLVFGWTLSFAPSSAAQDKWYEKAKWVSQDPYSFAVTYNHYLFPDTGVHVGGSGDFLYAILGRKTRDDIWSQPNHAKIIDSHTLTPGDVKTFHDFFLTKSDTVQMPYWAGGMGLIPLKVTSMVGAASTLIDVLLHLADNSAGRTKASELAGTMAVGGTFDRFYLISVDQDKHEYLSSNIVYSVKVGNETRSSIISSATYALKTE